MSERRAPNTGSIYPRKDGYWIAALTLPSDGKRRVKTKASKTEREAKANLKKMRAELEKAGDLPTSSPTLKAWLTLWLERIAKPRLKPRTYATYVGYVNNYLIPSIGSVSLEKLTTNHVRKMHAYVLDGRSSTTALQAHRILVVALRDAEREGRVGRNVATLVDAPARAVSTRGALSADDARALLRSVNGTPQAAYWAVALLAGLRQGERLGLTADSVDLDRGVLTVAWQLQRLKKGATIPAGQEAIHVRGGLWLTRPKSRAGWREVPIAPPLAEILRRYTRAHPPGESGLFFTHADGRAIDPPADSRAWHDSLAAANLDPVPLHSARHTCATLLYELGVPETTRIAILGHSSATVTAGYTHVNDKLKVDAMKQLGKLLSPAPKRG